MPVNLIKVKTISVYDPDVASLYPVYPGDTFKTCKPDTACGKKCKRICQYCTTKANKVYLVVKLHLTILLTSI